MAQGPEVWAWVLAGWGWSWWGRTPALQCRTGRQHSQCPSPCGYSPCLPMLGLHSSKTAPFSSCIILLGKIKLKLRGVCSVLTHPCAQAQQC